MGYTTSSKSSRTVLCYSIILSLTFNICPFICFSQEDFKPKFGNIDQASLIMTSYKGDSTIDAVYLYDYGSVDFRYEERTGFVMTTECWVRIKILRESAFDKASVSLVYYDGNGYENDERIEDLKGFTYNMEGNQTLTTSMDRKSIKKEKITNDHFAVKFNLANVKKGSVIEYSYTRITPLNYQIEPPAWIFQGSVPFAWSEYKINIPVFLDYRIITDGFLPFYIRKEEKKNITVGHEKYDGIGMSYRYVVKDSPAFVNEPFITTASDYLTKISFELRTIAVTGEMVHNYAHTWESIDWNLGEAAWFGGELRKNAHLKVIIDEISTKTKDPEERMNLAYSHIQNHMKWNGSNGLVSGEGAKRAYENKKGNVSDINITLISLLRALNIESDPIILSTRSHGQISRSNPAIESFNYVIGRVKIGEKEYDLDATQVYAKPGLLPEQAINGYARLITKAGSGSFVRLIPTDNQNKREMIQASISPGDGIIKGVYSMSYGGYEALHWRNKYVKEPESTYHEDLKKRVPEWKINEIRISNKNDQIQKAVNVNCNFEMEDESASSGMFYFTPVMVGKWAENPLKSPTRIYPLDFTSGINNSFIGNYKLPEGYVIEEMPKSEILSLPDKAGVFTYQIQQTGNVIQVSSSLIVSRLHFPPEEYEDLKEFFERVVQKHAQPVIIKKKAN